MTQYMTGNFNAIVAPIGHNCKCGCSSYVTTATPIVARIKHYWFCAIVCVTVAPIIRIETNHIDWRNDVTLEMWKRL